MTPAKAIERESAANDGVFRAVRGSCGLRADDAASLPSDSHPFLDLDPQWERFARFAGSLEAYIVAGRLNVEGVPTAVLVSAAPDLSSGAEILVPRALARRAHWVLSWPPVPEEELLFLATGELGEGDRS